MELCVVYVVFFFFKQKTAYEMRISDWSSDVCSSDLKPGRHTSRAAGRDLAQVADPARRQHGIIAKLLVVMSDCGGEALRKTVLIFCGIGEGAYAAGGIQCFRRRLADIRLATAQFVPVHPVAILCGERKSAATNAEANRKGAGRGNVGTVSL